MARRFLIPPEGWDGDTILLPSAELYHARRVLRLAEGDIVTAFDGAGREGEAVIEVLRRHEGRLRLLRAAEAAPRSGPRLVLLQGMPKAGKLEEIIEDACELGAHAVQPVVAARSVARPPDERGAAQAQRWHRRAVEAAKQCGRADVPEIAAPASLADALARFRGDAGAVGLIAAVGSGPGTLRQALAGAPPPAVWLAVGPEGGWAPEEVEAAVASGFQVVGLGPRILRTQTAGPALLALAGHAWGDLG